MSRYHIPRQYEMSMLYSVSKIYRSTFDFSTNMEGLFVVMLLFYVKKQHNLTCIVYQVTNLDNSYLRGLAYIHYTGNDK